VLHVLAPPAWLEPDVGDGCNCRGCVCVIFPLGEVAYAVQNQLLLELLLPDFLLLDVLT
jgi:hypothetical protein